MKYLLEDEEDEEDEKSLNVYPVRKQEEMFVLLFSL